MSGFVTVELAVVQTCSNQRTEVRVSVCQKELLRMQISSGSPFKCKTVTGDGIHFFWGGGNYRVLFGPEDYCLDLLWSGPPE